jgi:hypothetical protein
MDQFRTVTMKYSTSQWWSNTIRFYDLQNNIVEISCSDDDLLDMSERLEKTVERIKESRREEAQDLLREDEQAEQ